MSQKENAVAYAVTQICGLYGVRYTREQSRMFNVQGGAGRWRPMFFGEWTDDRGKIHRAGKADFLLRPRIRIPRPKGWWTPSQDPQNEITHMLVTVPLWVECKQGDEELRPAQEAFRKWVIDNGDFHLVIRDDARPLIDWFVHHGVEKNPDQGAVEAVLHPIDSSLVNSLPCRWAGCGKSREEHIGAALGCPGKSGKVWSPDLKKSAKMA